MLNKKFFITDDCLQFGRKQIFWDDIVGIKEYNDSYLIKFSNRFPRAELFLKSGKVLTVSNHDRFFQRNSSQKDSLDLVGYKEFVNTLRKKTKKQFHEFDHWISWRVFIPSALSEIISTLICVAFNFQFRTIAEISLLVAILTIPFGFLWEKKARIEIVKRNMDVQNDLSEANRFA